jgi:hypothetical protein
MILGEAGEKIKEKTDPERVTRYESPLTPSEHFGEI